MPTPSAGYAPSAPTASIESSSSAVTTSNMYSASTAATTTSTGHTARSGSYHRMGANQPGRSRPITYAAATSSADSSTNTRPPEFANPPRKRAGGRSLEKGSGRPLRLIAHRCELGIRVAEARGAVGVRIRCYRRLGSRVHRVAVGVNGLAARRIPCVRPDEVCLRRPSDDADVVADELLHQVVVARDASGFELAELTRSGAVKLAPPS